MKTITIQLKRLGKKKVKTLPFTITTDPKTLQEFIEACVQSEVTRFNEKRENVQLISFLTPKDIQEQSEKGKISFGDLANTQLAIEQEAVDNALLAFKDGLYVVFINDEPIEELSSPITLDKKSSITFIRMTFLSGTYW